MHRPPGRLSRGVKAAQIVPAGVVRRDPNNVLPSASRKGARPSKMDGWSKLSRQRIVILDNESRTRNGGFFFGMTAAISTRSPLLWESHEGTRMVLNRRDGGQVR
jgi:hypothetical protein